MAYKPDTIHIHHTQKSYKGFPKKYVIKDIKKRHRRMEREMLKQEIRSAGKLHKKIFRSVDYFHRVVRGWINGFAYNEGVYPDGVVIQGRRGRPASAAGHNKGAWAIVMFANLDDEYPSDEMWWSLIEVVRGRMMMWDIPKSKVKFHRDYTDKKTCPGKNVSKEQFMKDLEPQPV